MPSDPPGVGGSIEDALSIFARVRPRLFGLAYRMLGSAADAEDIVQNTWLRWQGTDRSAVVDPPAFLATVTTRLAINYAKSAHKRRSAYAGTWLPEPVDTSSDPRLGAEQGEALELAVLVLLEQLSPKERAVYVLREAFNYTHQQIADTLQLDPANVRQIAGRARKHLANGRPAPADAGEHRRLLTAFIAAAQRGDMAAMEGLFTQDVVSTSDGGGAVRAVRGPVVGRARVAKFIAKVATGVWAGVTVRWVEVNRQTAAALVRDRSVVALVAIDACGQGIAQVMWLMRPSKLVAAAPRDELSGPDPLPVGSVPTNARPVSDHN